MVASSCSVKICALGFIKFSENFPYPATPELFLCDKLSGSVKWCLAGGSQVNVTDEANLHSPFSSAALPWDRWQGIAVGSWVLPGGSAGRSADRWTSHPFAELPFRCEGPTVFHGSASDGQRPRNSGRGPSLLLSAWPREHALELFSADAKLAVTVVMSSPLFITRHNPAEKCFVLIPQTKRAMDRNG